MDVWSVVAIAALSCMVLGLFLYHRRSIATLESHLSEEKEARKSENLANQKCFSELEGKYLKLDERFTELVTKTTELRQKNEGKIADVKEQLTGEKRRAALRVLDFLFAVVKMVWWWLS